MTESNLCKLASYCKDHLNLQLSLALKEAPDKNLMDQHYELCTHPSEEVRECSCGNYKIIIRKAFVHGAEEVLINWHPEQVKQDLSGFNYLREASRGNREERKRGIRTWRR